MPREISIDVDGIVIRAEAGISLAAALARAGHAATRRSLRGEPRGAFCGMGTCFECRVRVNGIERLACITPVSAALERSGND
jgi:aerobic-type carbon monoxide dehydrogenase small subunit (CoxS/CutS family)